MSYNRTYLQELLVRGLIMDIITENFGNNLIIDYKGKEIKIRIFNMYNGQVKFGIEAPEGIPVHREEIYELIKAKKKIEPDDK